MTTPNLQLPEPPDFASPIAAEERDGQRALDALGPGWIAVLSATTTTPPVDPPQGSRYLVPEGAAGVWATHARHIAYQTPNGWGYRAPRVGWVVLVLDQGDVGRCYTYDGTEWVWMPTSTFDEPDPPPLPDATEIAFAGYGLPGDPLTVDAALEELFVIADDHEERIVILEGTVGGGGGGGGDGNVTPDTHPALPATEDDEFEAGVLAAKWNTLGSPTSVTLGQGAVAIYSPNSGSDNVCGIYQAMSGNFKVRTKLLLASGREDNRGGLFVQRSANSHIYTFGQYWDGTNVGFFVNHSNDETGATGLANNVTFVPASYAIVTGRRTMYFEIEYDGTNIIFRVSPDGYEGSFSDLLSVLASTHLGGAPDRVGPFASRNSTDQTRAYYDWFRRIS